MLRLFKKNKELLFSLLFIAVFGFSLNVLAVPPTTPYYSGETLDPDCSPGDTNCTVNVLHNYSAPVATANYGLVSLGSGAFDGSTSGYFVGESSGTFIGINSSAGFFGSYFNFQRAGTSHFKAEAQSWGDQLTIGSSDNSYPGFITLNGNRQVVIGAGNNAFLSKKGDSGGWTWNIDAIGSSGTSRGGFGWRGGGDLLTYYYIGTSYTNSTIKITDDGNVGIGTWNDASEPVSRLHIPVAPTASANYGLVSLGSGAFDGSTSGYFVGSASGTVIAINTASGYTGNFVDYQKAGASKFKILSSGFTGIGLDASTPTAMLTLKGTGATVSTQTLSISNTTREYLRLYDSERLHTKGKILIDSYYGTDTWTDSSNILNFQNYGEVTDIGTPDRIADSVMRITGSSTTANKGYFNNAVWTSYAATSTTSGQVTTLVASFNGVSGSAGTLGINYNVWASTDLLSGSALNITTNYGYFVRTRFVNGSLSTVDDNYGLFVDLIDNAGGSVTNHYGVYIDTGDNATSKNYGIYVADTDYKNYFAGKTAFGDSSDASYLIDARTDASSSYVANFFNDGSADNRYGILIQAGADSPSAGKWIQFNDGDGGDVGSVCYTGGQANICAPSDERLKENVTDSSMGLENLMNIKVRDFSYISDETHRVVRGFVAQELNDVYPDAVFAPVNPDEYWKVSYSQLIPLAVKSIQDLNVKFEAIKVSYNEDGSLAQELADFVLGVREIVTRKITTNELCLEDLCVTKEQFRTMLENNGVYTSGGSASPSPTSGESATDASTTDSSETESGIENTTDSSNTTTTDSTNTSDSSNTEETPTETEETPPSISTSTDSSTSI